MEWKQNLAFTWFRRIALENTLIKCLTFLIMLQQNICYGAHCFVTEITLCMLGNFSSFWCRLLTFFKINFFKKNFRNTIRCQTIWSRSKTNVLWVLIWVQTVCKGYQQTTKVTASMERVEKISNQNTHSNPIYSWNPRRVFLQAVKTQMKCSIMLHFIRVYTVCKGKKYLQTKEYNIFWKL